MGTEAYRELVKNADSGLVGLGWGLRFCISDRLPADADATALGPRFVEQNLVDTPHCLKRQPGALSISGVAGCL